MNDQEIVEAIKNGSIEAFKILIDEYKDRVFSCAYKFTGDYTETEDLSQEIFIKIYHNIHTFDSKSKLSTWIYRVSTNMCIDWKRQNKNRLKLNIYKLLVNKDKSNTFLPERDVIEKEDRTIIRSCIYELPDIYKEVLILYHYYEMSYKNIATELNVSEKTVETRLYRGRRLLKKQLGKNEYGGEIYGM